MNRGYNEERFRPLENDQPNKPETSKTAHQKEPASREPIVDDQQDDSPHTPETGTKEAEEEGGVSE